MDRAELLDKLRDPYRMACPRGHTNLVPSNRKHTVQCRSCGQTYAYEQLVDKAEKTTTRGGQNR